MKHYTQRFVHRLGRHRNAKPITHINQRGVRMRFDQWSQGQAINLAAPLDAAGAWGNVTPLAAMLFQTTHPSRAERILLGNGLGTHAGITIIDHPLTKIHGISAHHKASMLGKLT